MSQAKNSQLYRRLWAYARPYLNRVGISLVASLGVASADVASAKLVQPLVDLIIVERNYSLVNLVPFFIIGLAVFKGGSRYVQEYFIKTAGQLVVQDIRKGLYQHTLRLSMGFYSRTKSGVLMSRILNDVGYMQRSAADVLVDVLRESFTLVGLIALAFYNDWRLAIVAFVVLPLAVVPASIIGRRIRESTRRGQRTMGNLTSVLQETIAGIKVIKAYGTERQESERFKDEIESFYKYFRKTLKYDSLSAPIVEVLASFGVAGVFWYGIQRVLSGAITQGELFSFVAAVLMLYGPVKKLIRVNNVFQKSMAAADRVFELFDQVPEIQDKGRVVELERAAGEVAFEKVSFSYGDETVLKSFDLIARPGEVIALVGPSGAGKTTVASLLSRFYDPSEGVIRIDGHDLRDLSLQSLAHNVALVDQETFLFNETVANNIKYGRPSASEEEVLSAAQQAFADEFIRNLPKGYESRIGDRGTRLSGGQRQRLCIARAILHDSPILILDEATSALDTESEQMVQQALANLMKNRTTLVIAHRLSTIMNADRIVVMDKGRIVETGSHQELLTQGGLYRKLYDMQFRED